MKQPVAIPVIPVVIFKILEIPLALHWFTGYMQDLEDLC
jgi:hypothetical protein